MHVIDAPDEHGMAPLVRGRGLEMQSYSREKRGVEGRRRRMTKEEQRQEEK